MPKKFGNGGGGGGGNPSRSRNNGGRAPHFFQHDDRGGSDHRGGGDRFNDWSRRRPNKVMFKPQIHNSKMPARPYLKHFDDDVVMNGRSNGKFDVKLRETRRLDRDKIFSVFRANKPNNSDMRQKKKHFNDFNNWYKITIMNGQKYTKDYIVSLLLNYISPLNFVPIMYKIFEQKAVFYVDDFKVAQKLADSDKEITCIDGEKLSVRVKVETPLTDMSDTFKEKLKVVLAKRYVQETKALDLTLFHQDADIVNDYFCPLSNSTVLFDVIDVVRESVPDLEALRLDSNKILYAEKIGFLAKKLKKLKILHLSDNKIKDIDQLNGLRNLKLEELCLINNPVCRKYEGKKDEYVRNVREKFPDLLRLDNELLPPPIKFDVADDKVKIPRTESLFAQDKNAHNTAGQFLQQYFQVYDSLNRQPLLEAYDERAVFSMTVFLNKFSPYQRDNRNLKKINDINARNKMLQKGKLQIVAFLSQLPKTQHDLTAFTMDLYQCPATNMMVITVTGLFKELSTAKDKREHIRYFNRTFVIIPVGAGFCIVNEQMYIGEPTTRQEKGAFVTVEQAQPLQVTEEVKQQMILSLNRMSNMNVEWSLRCLEEVQWNYEVACTAFQKALAAGQIPAEAFKTQ